MHHQVAVPFEPGEKLGSWSYRGGPERPLV